MKLKVFTLRLDETSGAFDDSELQAFLEDKLVLAVHEHFFVHERTPTWALLVSYRAADAKRSARSQPARARRDWRAELPAADHPLFDALRSWRNETARRDGRPAYVLLTNQQVAEIARRRPRTLSALQEVEGIGPARVEALGKQILALVSAAPVSAGEPEGAVERAEAEQEGA